MDGFLCCFGEFSFALCMAAEQNRHCPFQTDRLFFGMACLANLKGDAVNEKENIFGAGYQPQAVRKIAGGKVPYPKDVR